MILKNTLKEYSNLLAVENEAKQLANAARTEAKRAIGKIRAGETDAADTLLSNTEKHLKALSVIAKKHPEIAQKGYYGEAVEE